MEYNEKKKNNKEKLRQKEHADPNKYSKVILYIQGSLLTKKD